MRLNDWKREAARFSDIDKAAREEAERALEEQRRYQNIVIGKDQHGLKKLVDGLRRSMRQ